MICHSERSEESQKEKCNRKEILRLTAQNDKNGRTQFAPTHEIYFSCRAGGDSPVRGNVYFNHVGRGLAPAAGEHRSPLPLVGNDLRVVPPNHIKIHGRAWIFSENGHPFFRIRGHFPCQGNHPPLPHAGNGRTVPKNHKKICGRAMHAPTYKMHFAG